MVQKIISGGPTGADRAALAVALALGLPVGGGCPPGRRAEDGTIPDRYPLAETPEHNYEARTRRNIEDSDGTLILNLGTLDGGTALTADHARQVGKPCLVVALEAGIEPAAFRAWLDRNQIAVLNVAGPRESQRPGVYGCIPILQRPLNNQASYSRHQGLDGLEPSATFEGNPQVDNILCPWRTPMLPTALHTRLQHSAVCGFHGAAADHQATRPVLVVSHPIHIVAVIGLERLPRLPCRFGQGDELAQGFQHMGDVPGIQLRLLAFHPAVPPRFIRGNYQRIPPECHRLALRLEG